MDTNDPNRKKNHHPQSTLPNQQQQLQQQQQKKKCHGNRRNQRFRRKCRANKMESKKIKKLIKKRNHRHKKIQKGNSRKSKTNPNVELTSEKIYQSQPIITTTTNVFKRKREISSQQLSKATSTIPKSTSSISIVQPSLKKMKNITKTMSTSIFNTNYRYVFKNCSFFLIFEIFIIYYFHII